jgi:CBS domain-containing protein
MMNTVKDMLRVKGREVWSIGPDAPVYDALSMMADKGVGALLVLEGGGVVGIVSERDYARKVDLKRKSSRQTPVRDIMTPEVVYVRPENTVEECMALMTHKRIRHLPVMEDDKVVGVISIGDVVKAIISEQQFVIEQLERYISGR